MLGFRFFIGELILTSDYVMTFPGLLPMFRVLEPYAGAGLVVVLADEFESLVDTEIDQSQYFGLRGVGGAMLPLSLFDLPFQVYAEGTPGLLIVPAGRIFFGLTLGARYLF
jgi:hypothetical protein